MIEMGPRGRNMAVRTKLVAGNWKMNGLREDGAALARALVQRMVAAGASGPDCQLLVCPPATLLTTVGGLIAGSRIALGGQDCHAAAKGAFTGDTRRHSHPSARPNADPLWRLGQPAERREHPRPRRGRRRARRRCQTRRRKLLDHCPELRLTPE